MDIPLEKSNLKKIDKLVVNIEDFFKWFSKFAKMRGRPSYCSEVRAYIDAINEERGSSLDYLAISLPAAYDREIICDYEDNIVAFCQNEDLTNHCIIFSILAQINPDFHVVFHVKTLGGMGEIFISATVVTRDFVNVSDFAEKNRHYQVKYETLSEPESKFAGFGFKESLDSVGFGAGFVPKAESESS
jgi:hypothetical protein